MRNTILRAVVDPRIRELHASHTGSRKPSQEENVAQCPVKYEEFKGLLENEYRRLVYSQRVTDESFHHSLDDLMEETDWCLSQRELDLRRKLRGREAEYAKKLKEALDRIACGTFGKCVACEEEIDVARLYARPTATLCVSCQEVKEAWEQSTYLDPRSFTSSPGNISDWTPCKSA